MSKLNHHFKSYLIVIGSPEQFFKTLHGFYVLFGPILPALS